MRNRIFTLMLLTAGLVSPAKLSAGEDIPSLDSMDKIYDTLQKQSNRLKDQIQEAQRKIDEAQAAKAEKEKQENKTNYWIPIAGGALLGIALAWWLRRKK